MRYYGKILGFIAGMALTRHPAGGVIGAVIGHAFDSNWFSSSKGPDHYQVLGIDSEASDAEVERAYRRLITQYHPDRLQGVAQELRDQAETKARAINAAYEAIQKQRRKR